MATQAVTLQRREIEHLLQAAGNARALEQLTTRDDHAAVIVVVLANTDQENAQATNESARLAAGEGMESPTTLPRRDSLARRRRELCKTQERLAMDVGVQRSTVARWESGDTTPSLWARPRIADALGVTLDLLDELLGTSLAGEDLSHMGMGDGVETASAPRPPAVA